MAAVLTYGGVALGVVGSPSGLKGQLWRWATRNLPSEVIRQEKAAQWIEENISPSEVNEFASRLTWPGVNLAGLTFQPWVPSRPIRIGSLYWPVGASRWATAHFVATGEMVDTLLPLAYGLAAPWKPVALDFVMDTGKDGQKITTKLFMLPPRPLTRVGDYAAPPVAGNKRNRFYLLTLVDERFYWWFHNTGQIAITTEPLTAWTELYDHVGVQLNIAIGRDNPDAGYGHPHAYSVLAKRYESLPPILDALALNCGQRIVRKLDGTVKATNLTNSKTQRDANLATALAKNKRQAGDWFDFGRDLSAVLPKRVRCVFQRWVFGVPQANNYWSETVDLNAVAGFGDYTGHAGEKLYHCLCPANCQGPAEVPDNQATLQGLAFQLATSFYGYLKESYLDRVYAGVLAWTPECLHDVEWTWRLDRCNTRVQRLTWNLDPEEMLQADGSEVNYCPTVVTDVRCEGGQPVKDLLTLCFGQGGLGMTGTS